MAKQRDWLISIAKSMAQRDLTKCHDCLNVNSIRMLNDDPIDNLKVQ